MTDLSTFNYFWALVAPVAEYERKRNDCKALWDSLPIQRQRIIYRVIQRKKENGEKVHPNPFFALEDNINVEPDFLSGMQQEEAWERGIPLVMVKYHDRYLICTEETQKMFGLEFVMKWEKRVD
ncbi:MAG: hypothetical protein IKX20_00625 [Paludibacteraceae bacterium]|nr:hypothetical protein [Paludibacteraceae bacterium]